jgi:hypothetical protein
VAFTEFCAKKKEKEQVNKITGQKKAHPSFETAHQKPTPRYKKVEDNRATWRMTEGPDHSNCQDEI